MCLGSFPDLQKSIFAQEYLRVVQQQVSTHLEAFYLPLGLWLEAYIWPTADGIAVQMRDISDRKRLEADLLTQSAPQRTRNPDRQNSAKNRIPPPNLTALH
jgi:hypothetical protein